MPKVSIGIRRVLISLQFERVLGTATYNSHRPCVGGGSELPKETPTPQPQSDHRSIALVLSYSRHVENSLDLIR